MAKPVDNPIIHVIIVAAGSGKRFGSDMPKQFLDLDGRPVLMHTIERFRQACPEARITVTLSADMTDFWADLCHRHGFASPRIAIGGATRWESARNSLASLSETADNSVVLIHDGARPLVDVATMRRVVDAIGPDKSFGAIPVVPVTDSLREVFDAGSRPVDRSHFRAVQTPQGFLFGALWEAYQRPYQATFTDDASVFEAAFPTRRLALVDGSPSNIKITNPADLAIAETLLKMR